ncbi:hypothetical protein HK405_004083 [Cladochytrium tenue]|nr:hypothetical protein HK405_004083 [Cladochytrium tenue]
MPTVRQNQPPSARKRPVTMLAQPAYSPTTPTAFPPDHGDAVFMPSFVDDDGVGSSAYQGHHNDAVIKSYPRLVDFLVADTTRFQPQQQQALAYSGDAVSQGYYAGSLQPRYRDEPAIEPVPSVPRTKKPRRAYAEITVIAPMPPAAPAPNVPAVSSQGMPVSAVVPQLASYVGLAPSPPSSTSPARQVVTVVPPQAPPTASSGRRRTKEERDQARKVSHSAIERRRRERINDKIARLRSLVPACHAPHGGAASGDEEGSVDVLASAGAPQQQQQQHKLTVLQHTIEYIEKLQLALAVAGQAGGPDVAEAVARVLETPAPPSARSSSLPVSSSPGPHSPPSAAVKLEAVGDRRPGPASADDQDDHDDGAWREQHPFAAANAAVPITAPRYANISWSSTVATGVAAPRPQSVPQPASPPSIAARHQQQQQLPHPRSSPAAFVDGLLLLSMAIEEDQAVTARCAAPTATATATSVAAPVASAPSSSSSTGSMAIHRLLC